MTKNSDHYDFLIENFKSKIDITLNQEKVICSKFSIVTLRKKRFFLNYNQISKHIGFIAKGSLRAYSIDSKGNEHVTQLAIENHWISDLYSFFKQEDSKTYIETIENSTILVISKENLDALYTEVPKVERFFRKLFQNAYITTLERLNKNLSKSAPERYKELLQNSPDIGKRIPLIHIASYIGITPESLSRIRKSI